MDQIPANSKATKQPSSQKFRSLAIESLEDRLVPTANLVNGILSIVGGATDNLIAVSRDDLTNEIVYVDNLVESGRWDSAMIQRIDIFGGAGNDTIGVDDNVVQAVSIAGNAGNDILKAGSGPTTIDGGLGDDQIFGGIAADLLFGSAGNDSIFGGAGKDNIEGGIGNDILGGGEGDDRIQGDAGNDTIAGMAGNDMLYGGLGDDEIYGGDDQHINVEDGNDLLVGGDGADAFSGGGGSNALVGGDIGDMDLDKGIALIQFTADNPISRLSDVDAQVAVESTENLTIAEITQLLGRAAAATSSQDAIIVVVDRTGTIRGVQIEAGVAAQFQTLGSFGQVFAVDGAAAKARTAAIFASNAAPLTSRSIQFISQTTITLREVQSQPGGYDPNTLVQAPANTNDLLRGPGFVAPVGIGQHFPPNVAFTPDANLFNIEASNRESLIQPGADGIKAPGDAAIMGRFNSLAYMPASGLSAATLPFMESWGGPTYISRGIGTLPGGIPLYKNGQLVGGIGVFFPGQTGYATEENSSLSADYDPTKPDRSFEAEYIAFAAAGGTSAGNASIGTLGGIAPVAGFDLPFGRIDIDGITVPVYGPMNPISGVGQLVSYGQSLGQGVNNGAIVGGTTPGTAITPGMTVPNGWLIGPRDASPGGGNLTAVDVQAIIQRGIAEANITRANIRLPLGTRTQMVFAVSDTNGNILGLYRMPDATVFSVDVAAAKSRNTAYYDDATALQPIDQVATIPAGASFTARTFRYLAEPRFPTAVDVNSNPGAFSILNVTNLFDTSLPATAYFNNVMGHDVFYPQTNFHEPSNPNQNGIVFFPGSAGLYKDTNGDGQRDIVGGVGVSGDGVDQDDVVTNGSLLTFNPNGIIPRADQTILQGIRLPYIKFSRNPRG